MLGLIALEGLGHILIAFNKNDGESKIGAIFDYFFLNKEVPSFFGVAFSLFVCVFSFSFLNPRYSKHENIKAIFTDLQKNKKHSWMFLQLCVFVAIVIFSLGLPFLTSQVVTLLGIDSSEDSSLLNQFKMCIVYIIFKATGSNFIFFVVFLLSLKVNLFLTFKFLNDYLLDIQKRSKDIQERSEARSEDIQKRNQIPFKGGGGNDDDNTTTEEGNPPTTTWPVATYNTTTEEENPPTTTWPVATSLYELTFSGVFSLLYADTLKWIAGWIEIVFLCVFIILSTTIIFYLWFHFY